MREDVIREQLISTLEGKGSHIPFATAIHKFLVALVGTTPIIPAKA
jgi:hypothetical protein